MLNGASFWAILENVGFSCWDLSVLYVSHVWGHWRIFVRLQMFVLLSRNVTTHTWDRYCCTFYTESTVLLLLLILNIQYSTCSYSYPYINLAPIRVTLILGTSTLSTEARFLGETIHRHWILVYAILQQINCNNIRYIYNAIHIQYTCTTHQAKQLLWGSERVSHLRL